MQFKAVLLCVFAEVLRRLVCLLVRIILSLPCLANRICRGLGILLCLKVFLRSVCSYCMCVCVWSNMEELPAFMSRSVLVVKPAGSTWS